MTIEEKLPVEVIESESFRSFLWIRKSRDEYNLLEPASEKKQDIDSQFQLGFTPWFGMSDLTKTCLEPIWPYYRKHLFAVEPYKNRYAVRDFLLYMNEKIVHLKGEPNVDELHKSCQIWIFRMWLYTYVDFYGNNIINKRVVNENGMEYILPYCMKCQEFVYEPSRHFGEHIFRCQECSSFRPDLLKHEHIRNRSERQSLSNLKSIPFSNDLEELSNFNLETYIKEGAPKFDTSQVGDTEILTLVLETGYLYAGPSVPDFPRFEAFKAMSDQKSLERFTNYLLDISVALNLYSVPNITDVLWHLREEVVSDLLTWSGKSFPKSYDVSVVLLEYDKDFPNQHQRGLSPHRRRLCSPQRGQSPPPSKELKVISKLTPRNVEEGMLIKINRQLAGIKEKLEQNDKEAMLKFRQEEYDIKLNRYQDPPGIRGQQEAIVQQAWDEYQSSLAGPNMEDNPATLENALWMRYEVLLQQGSHIDTMACIYCNERAELPPDSRIICPLHTNDLDYFRAKQLDHNESRQKNPFEANRDPEHQKAILEWLDGVVELPPAKYYPMPEIQPYPDDRP